jgi:hypothetical protein
MPIVTKYEPGTPCWVELATTDVAAAKTFYTTLFGWDYDEGGEETGFYVTPRLKGSDVAGMMARGEDERAQGVPPMWRTYVCVESADDAAAKVTELGGTVLAPPFDVMDLGRVSVFLDTEGALISAWEPKQHHGSGIVNEPGAWGWSELATRDPEKAKAFYTALFGWNAHDSDPSAGMVYTEWQVGDRSVGGMLKITAEMGEMPPSWSVYFQVDDCDATVERAKANGGALFFGPEDIPTVGRFAVLADPQGAIFQVITTADGV